MSYFTWTGNPWVDAGVSSIIGWNNKKNPEDITVQNCKNISDSIVKLYTTKSWSKNLYSVFPNNPITNPSEKNKKQSYKKLLETLIEGFHKLGNEGDCVACGRRNAFHQKNRMHIPLSGRTGSHYFSYTAQGVDYCDVCTFAVQCLPLVLYKCGNLALIHSNSEKVLRYWSKQATKNVSRQISSRNYTGCFDDGYKNAMNALFHITQDLILQYDEKWAAENATIRIYHFSNYLQGPDLSVYDLPATVFRFLAYIKRHPRYSDWIKVVRRGYYYNINNKDPEEYKNYPNIVYQRLINEESIIKYFTDGRKKEAFGNWNLLSHYLKEVLQMDKSRIDTIRKFADEIVDVIKESPNGAKRLSGLERADNYTWYRNVLRKIIKDRIALGKDQPLFTFEEYVEQLFPDGALGWKETQDLILFRIYEKLHNWLLKQGIVKEETEEEESEVESE